MHASCVRPTDGLQLTADTRLAPGTYVVPGGLTLAADGLTLDGNGAVLVGDPTAGAGIMARGRSGLTLRNLRLVGYRHGIRIEGGANHTLVANRIRGTGELPANSEFLDIWRGPEEAYGAAVMLCDVGDSRIEENDFQHQQTGLLSYDSRRLEVRGNQASYNSGFGFYLNRTTDSVLEGNCADYCCRFEPREGGVHAGHMGADAAGFVAVRGSSRNVFRRNAARLGGDGFFLAGLSPDDDVEGCDDNLFEENDGSWSPNIAFEATFCRGNVFRGNRADRSNYGFWLGFSRDTVLEENRMIMNRQAGIAVENGVGFEVRGNHFQGNGHGVLIWTRHVPRFADLFPENRTSCRWGIERNTLCRNGRAIRIAAHQDHGIRDLGPGEAHDAEARPREHVIHANEIQDNRIGIDLVNADETRIERNVLNGNVEANLRQSDCRDTVVRDNLGPAGGYL